MRKRYRILVFAALVAALVVPVGYALSVESTPSGAYSQSTLGLPAVATGTATPAAAAVATPIVITSAAPATFLAPLRVPDAAKLFGIGTVLFGLAAIVRKAV